MRSSTPIVSLIYGHLRMGLPLLLGVGVQGVGLHAVTLTGYSLRDKSVHSGEDVPPPGEPPCIPMPGLRIDEFYAHDDQNGPFTRLRVRHPPPSPNPVTNRPDLPVFFEEDWIDPQTGKSNTRALFPFVIIVPVYHKIRVTFLDVLKWLTRLHRNVVQMLKVPGAEWDLHLTTTNIYKKQIFALNLPKQQLRGSDKTPVSACFPRVSGGFVRAS